MQELHAVRVALDVDGFMRNVLGGKKLFRAQAAGSPRAPEDVDRIVGHARLRSVRWGQYSGSLHKQAICVPSAPSGRKFLTRKPARKQEKMPLNHVFIEYVNYSHFG
jgi:hypothetical protein